MFMGMANIEDIMPDVEEKLAEGKDRSTISSEIVEEHGAPYLRVVHSAITLSKIS